MTIRFVGSGGSDANSGLTWATRKLTLNGAEDSPVAAGDTVYVGPGTYRELLTVDVAGTVGNPITYIGDFTGINTDGVGGVVRITGSDDDKVGVRANCISLANARSYRTFQGFLLDLSTGVNLNLAASSTNLTINNCVFHPNTGGATLLSINGTGGAHVIHNCVFWTLNAAIQIIHTSTVDNSGTVIDNCFVIGSGTSINIRIDRVGGITVKNCSIIGAETCLRVNTALSVGQTVNVNNCILTLANAGFIATAMGEITENNNTLFGCVSPRTTVATGTNSNLFPPLFDNRPMFLLMYGGAGPNNPVQMVSPFDLASYSPLVSSSVTGTSPSVTDMRGTAVVGAQREWGPLEFDGTLSVKARQGGMIGGGFVKS